MEICWRKNKRPQPERSRCSTRSVRRQRSCDERLGESLASVQKYDALPEDTTTSSLEALQAYALGHKATDIENDYLAAIPFFQRAISLDPNFAMAYLQLGEAYQPQGEDTLAAQYTRKAYELRERTSDHEKLNIAAFYEIVVTGNLEAARRAFELFAQTYPRDEFAEITLWFIYLTLGDYAKADAAAQRAFKINPASSNNYVSLVYCDQWLNRLDQAKATVEKSRSEKLDSPWFPLVLYVVDFLKNDPGGMEQQAAAPMGIPGVEDQMFFLESETAADGGQFNKARDLTRQAAESARRAQEKETAAEYLGHNSLREALVGKADWAKEDAQSAVAEIKGKHGEGFSAIACALAGDTANANSLIADLEKRFQQDTVVQSQYLPMARAALALNRGDAAAAVQALAAASPYELGHNNDDFTFALYPVYLRGESYLAAKNGSAALTEFQKILDHAGSRRKRAYRRAGAPGSRVVPIPCPAIPRKLRLPIRIFSLSGKIARSPSGNTRKLRLPIRISSLSGKMPIPTFRSEKAKADTPSCNESSSDQIVGSLPRKEYARGSCAEPVESPLMADEQKAKQRLEIAHVLFMDIVDYSKLLTDEQSEALQELNQIVRNTETAREAEAAGQLTILPTGDGMALVFTGSVEEPVECALEISHALRAQPSLPVRMGIHSGPVHHVKDANQRENIAGVGINIAQRVMDCGDAGHILVSKRVADDLAQQRRWQPYLHELGDVEVKHGVVVSLVNLYAETIGNPTPPARLGKVRGRISGSRVGRAKDSLRSRARSSLSR